MSSIDTPAITSCQLHTHTHIICVCVYIFIKSIVLLCISIFRECPGHTLIVAPVRVSSVCSAACATRTATLCYMLLKLPASVVADVHIFK